MSLSLVAVAQGRGSRDRVAAESEYGSWEARREDIPKR